MVEQRIPIPTDIAATVLFRADRTCCVCREQGKPIQIHHIDGNPANNDPINLAVLCFDCHDKTQIKGGFARKLDAAQVIHYRDDWSKRLQERRNEADKIAAAAQGGDPQSATSPIRRESVPDPRRIANYIRTLPAVLRDIYSRSKPKWDSGNTPRMNEGSRDVIDVLEQVLITLADTYPPQHFGGRSSRDYMNAMTAARYIWHRAHLEPNGVGTGGTIIRTITGGCVMADLEEMVDEIVASLSEHLPDFDFESWRNEWNSARRSADPAD